MENTLGDCGLGLTRSDCEDFLVCWLGAFVCLGLFLFAFFFKTV